MPFKVFISSVQREFAVERKLLAEYIRKDVILGRFFEVFLFEDVPAQERSASDVYLSEVDASDIYLGILGATYGHVDRKGVSATEREYERAEKKQKERICFVKTVSGEREPAEAKFVERVNAERTRKGFADWDGLRVGVYSALANYLGNKGLISVLPFDSSKSAGVQLKDLDTAKMREFIRDAREIRGWGIEPPRWENDDGDFAVTLRRIPVAAATEKSTLRTTMHTTTHATIQTTIDNLGLVGGAASVLRAILSHPTASLKELASSLGMTKDGVFYHVRNLRSIGLKHVGARDRGCWTLDGSDVPPGILKGGLKSGLDNKCGVTRNVTRNLTDLQSKIIALVAEEDQLTQRQIAQRMGVVRMTVIRNMAALMRFGIIRRVGPDKGGHWEVVGLK